MAEKKERITNKRNANPQPMAILIELENIAVQGRRLMYEALSDILEKKGAKMKPFLFSRFCLYSSSKKYLPDLLKAVGKERLSADKMAEEVDAAIAAAFSRPGLKLPADLKKSLKALAEKGFVVGALCCLPKAVAQSLATNLGLEAMGVRMLAGFNEQTPYPGVEAWLKLAKISNVQPFRTVVVATSSLSCKAALAARMKSIAIPDSFTIFEDFCGADYLVNSLDEVGVDKLLTLLEFAW